MYRSETRIGSQSIINFANGNEICEPKKLNFACSSLAVIVYGRVSYSNCFDSKTS